ncbi:unnamed protein product [Effrenium voratum]|uniref:Uncharacterized protein n=1 Tax=Effrenium voratum TaxID=2562239 RepID=A0AA36IRA2_9DINO|nr:unnamed protein product [Effrenium voratum]
MTGDAASRALREAQLFRTCLHLRRQQRQRLLSEALRASTAEANEAALIFAQDRVDFALQQATLLAKELPPDSPLRHWDASLWSQEAQRSQRLLLRRRQLRQELDQQWSQAQLALNRLRALQSLATKSIEPAGADEPKARGQLLALLQSCEQTLLKGTSQCDLAAEMADTEGSDVFLESVVPVLHGKTQGAVPEKRASSASAEEEVRLRLMLQDLSDHNEALRRELQQCRETGVSNSSSEPTAAFLKHHNVDVHLDTPEDAEEAAQALREGTELRKALAVVYEQLARWQQEDPEAGKVLARLEGAPGSEQERRRRPEGGEFAA